MSEAENVRNRLAKALPASLTVSRYGDDHVRVYGMIHNPDAAALADRLEQAEAALAACDKWIAIAVDPKDHSDTNMLARIALPIVSEIHRALNPDTGGADARAMLDQVHRDPQADLTRIHDTIRPGLIGGTDA